MASRQMQDSELPVPPSQLSPKRVLETIYGSRFMRNSKQLTPLNTSGQDKNAKLGVSSDYYTFQRSLANSKNKPQNPQKQSQKFRKTFSISKPSATQLPQHSRTKLLLNYNYNYNHSNIHKGPTPRSTAITQEFTRASIKVVMNNTTTGFKCAPSSRSPEKVGSGSGSVSKVNIMNTTAQSFRPPTNGYMRQCNNQAEDRNNYLSKYEIIKELGKGTYGVVHLARKKAEKANRVSSGKKMEDSFLFAYGSMKRERERGEETMLEFQAERKEDGNESQGGEKEKEKEKEEVEQVNTSLVYNEQGNREDILPPLRSQSPALSLKFPQTSSETPSQPQPQPTPEQYSQSQQLFAIKIYQKFKMNKDPTKFKNIRKEINVMQNIKHPHIIKLYETVQTLTKISLVVEFGGKQSLLDYLKENFPISESVMRRIGGQLLSALEYLHEKNIVHRDIKLQNILMLNGDVKIIDFGFSTLTYKNRKLNAICGTPNYMAPEVLSKKEYIGELADMWSYGVVMFTIAEGRHPFKAETYNELERLVDKGNYQFKRVTNPVHQSFIKRILKLKPQERPRACELSSHPWLMIKQESTIEGGK